MPEPCVSLKNVSLRFRLSYDKSYTIKDWLVEGARSLYGGKKPEFFTALDNVSLDVYDGDIIGVIGPNGSGKSTLLKVISGILSPDAGEVESYGRLSSLLSLGTGFNNQLSGQDNIRFQGMLIGMTPEEIDAAMPDIIAFADVGKFIDVPMKYYSSGMISRLSFAIVLAMQPDILLIDEIFSVGDLEFRKKSEMAMDRLLKQAKCQMIVTHTMTYVREHCNRAVYINKGAVRADGDPDAVVDQYIADVEGGTGEEAAA